MKNEIGILSDKQELSNTGLEANKKKRKGSSGTKSRFGSEILDSAESIIGEASEDPDLDLRGNLEKIL